MVEHPVDDKHFSAEVRLELRTSGEVFDLASIGPNEITPRNPLDLPACNADVVMVVDGTSFLWPVRLPHGAVPFQTLVTTVPRGEMQRLG